MKFVGLNMLYVGRLREPEKNAWKLERGRDLLHNQAQKQKQGSAPPATLLMYHAPCHKGMYKGTYARYY